jgi:hypothetical protein
MMTGAALSGWLVEVITLRPGGLAPRSALFHVAMATATAAARVVSDEFSFDTGITVRPIHPLSVRAVIEMQLLPGEVRPTELRAASLP